MGDLHAKTTDNAVELWLTQTAKQALIRLVGSSQKKELVAGVGFGFSFPAHNPPTRSATRASEPPFPPGVGRAGVEPATN